MREAKSSPRVSWIGLIASMAVLAALVSFTIVHLGDASQFAQMVERAQPQWVILALALQVGTYVCVGAIWRAVLATGGSRLGLLQLARLAIEQLSIDQLMPSGGVSGNLVVGRAMRRHGVPVTIALEALIINILAHYVMYAIAAMLAMLILWSHHEVTRFMASLLAVFSIVVATVPAVIVWLIRHREWRPGRRLARLRFLQRFQDAVAGVSPERVRNPRLLALAAALNLAVFVLDAGTLWALLRAVGQPIAPTTAFAALVVGEMAGTISFLPGGIGSFEAGCTLTLKLLGVPVEVALTGTLLLRGLTLWLPLIPGGLLARKDLAALRGAGGSDVVEPRDTELAQLALQGPGVEPE